jgi:transposase
MSDLRLIENEKNISELVKRLERLELRVLGLETQNETLIVENRALKEANSALKEANSALKEANSALHEGLSKSVGPKNSRNSSIPPSKDENRPKKNQSLRRPTGKRPGGQPGHKGSTLEMTRTPHRVIDLVPEYCNACGLSLEKAPPIGKGKRQVVDIPPIKAHWTEYRTYGKICPCGRCTVPDFPEGADFPVSYGANIEALIGYFHARQYLPFARMREMLGDVFNIDISEGGIHCLLGRFADRATPFYRMIGQRVAASKVVGTDETGVKVNGDKHWFWTWQSPKLTYIAHSPTRGKAAVDAHFPQGFPGATLVHDGWRPQVGTLAGHHQSCLPHLLRHLNYLNEKYGDARWGTDFKVLLCEAMELDRDGPTQQGRAIMVQRLDRLLEDPPARQHRELFTFYKRMCRERQHLLTFLFIKDVPPDNNASERAIRGVKVKQKVSGQFKTERAAQNFAKIRSVIDTTIKNGQDVVEALSILARFQPRPAN